MKYQTFEPESYVIKAMKLCKLYSNNFECVLFSVATVPPILFICITKLPPAQHGTTLLCKPEKPMAKLGNQETFPFPCIPM